MEERKPINDNNITADDLFLNVKNIVEASTEYANRAMHQTLELACTAALKDTPYGFGDLNSKVNRICDQCHIELKERHAIQRMRRHSNHHDELTHEEMMYDARALAVFISEAFHTDIPSYLTGKLPMNVKVIPKGLRVDARYVRCIVRDWNDKTIEAIADSDADDCDISINYATDDQFADMTYLKDILCQGMQLNLLDCQVTGNTYIPQQIIVEPDYLIDISSIANCFEEYGHHPLSFTLSRMKERPNNKYTLLGNFAGSALDDIINNGHYNYADTLKGNFREKALEYCTCTDLDTSIFKEESEKQVKNMEQIVTALFSKYDREKALLEPSFVCERLGLQGRVDLMTSDFKLLVEQKSGKNGNIEYGRRNEHGNYHIEKHYVQALLYYGVLRYNFNLASDLTNVFLLYSKYPLPAGLLDVARLGTLFNEAMELRNKIVAQEIDIATNGFDGIIEALTPETLNTNGINNTFYNNYLLPQIEKITKPLHQLPPLEKAYFCRMMTFVYREQMLSKLGTADIGGRSMADTWNMPISEKRELGNIYTDLKIIGKERSSDYNGYDTITLSTPDYGDDFLPNFRRGDMVYLYAYREDEEPDMRKSILYKGAMEEIHTDRIVVHLNDGQQNSNVICGDTWAVEHGGSDMGSTSAVYSLHTFVTAPEERRQLLLCQCKPTSDTTLSLRRSYNKYYDDILLKVKQANEMFLLIGPPGSGKTSMAMRYIVEEELQKDECAILLMAYTNRAVDEICAMLCDADIDFLRIGNEYACDPKYVKNLFGHTDEESPKLSERQQQLINARVIVGSTSMMTSRSSLFRIKHFTLAVVDEASQILEPNIIGLLASHIQSDGNGETTFKANNGCDIDKFIMIGDYKQLPAVVQQSATDSAVDNSLLMSIGLDNCRNSLFERLIRNEYKQGRTDFIGILHRQGRMHPDVAAFPDDLFYNTEQLMPVPLKHQLQEALDYKEPSVDALDDMLKQHRMVFIPSKPCSRIDISDKVNNSEAVIVADVLRRIRRFYGKYFDSDKTVGVIVPYRNQITMIRREIDKLGIPELENISIDTVERYQGSQRDVIIYSFTIQHRYQIDVLASNCFKENGFVIDRKLNVALTRARKQMIMTGNEKTLSFNPIFSKLIDYVKAKNGYFIGKIGKNDIINRK